MSYFISDEEHKRTLVYMAAAEKIRCFQWEFFCNFNKLVNTMSHTQWAFGKHKPAANGESVEERVKEQAMFFDFLQKNSLLRIGNLCKLKMKLKRQQNPKVCTLP